MKLLPLKLHIYKTIYRLNRAFELVRVNLDELDKLGLDRRSMREYASISEELRAETNHRLTEILNEREERDWARFGRLTLQREKRLRDPNDVLLEAERIRTKQRRQHPPERSRHRPRK